MIQKTFVIQIHPSEKDISILQTIGKESARWMNQVFRVLYADKRNRGWKEFGANGTRNEYGHLKFLSKKGNRWVVNGRALYSSFIRKDAPYHLTDSLGATELQLLSDRVATTWSNFLNGDIPRATGRLPEFHSVIMFNVDSFVLHEGRLRIKLSKEITVETSRSKDLKYNERLQMVLSKSGWSAVEVKQHEDGKWYAHIPVSVDTPNVLRKIKGFPVMGVDVGIRNTMTTAIIKQEKEIPLMSVPPFSGRNTFHRLELVHQRIRELRSCKDKGKKSAKHVLERLKGKKKRIQETMAWMAAHAIAKHAESEGVKGIAIEDLRGGFKPTVSRKMNRLILGWNRGKARDILVQKAAERGIAVHEVYARGTSSTCPVCQIVDSKARNRKTHTFTCKKCGFIGNDDFVGALNIAHRGWRYWNSSKWDQNITVDPAMQVVSGGTLSGDTHSIDSGPSSATKPTEAQGPAIHADALISADDETSVARTLRTGRIGRTPHLSGEARMDLKGMRGDYIRAVLDLDVPDDLSELSFNGISLRFR